MDIQNHTRNHPLLSNLEAGPIAAQLTGCSQAIADHLFGKIARHHAYPSGVESAPVRSVLAELNFRTATTTRPRHVQRGDDPLLLPRYTLKNDTTLAEFQRWLRLDPEESPPAGSR
jgi:peptidoglycan/xylan/chitin deacetylase (PgdA/CDA1 family)